MGVTINQPPHLNLAGMYPLLNLLTMADTLVFHRTYELSQFKTDQNDGQDVNVYKGSKSGCLFFRCKSGVGHVAKLFDKATEAFVSMVENAEGKKFALLHNSKSELEYTI